MQFEKLTIKSQEALGEAQSSAGARGHGRIEPAHLLRALLSQPEGSTIPIRDTSSPHRQCHRRDSRHPGQRMMNP